MKFKIVGYVEREEHISISLMNNIILYGEVIDTDIFCEDDAIDVYTAAVDYMGRSYDVFYSSLDNVVISIQEDYEDLDDRARKNGISDREHCRELGEYHRTQDSIDYKVTNSYSNDHGFTKEEVTNIITNGEVVFVDKHGKAHGDSANNNPVDEIVYDNKTYYISVNEQTGEILSMGTFEDYEQDNIN